MAATLAATLLIVAAVALPDVSSRKIPSYVKLCNKSEPDFDACLINSVETLRPRMNKGIPKLNVPPIEPFRLPELEINRNLQAIQMRAILQNVAAYGASGFIINRLKADPEKLTLELSITLPHILLAPIKSKGIFRGNFTDVQGKAKVDGKVTIKDGVEYLQVNNIKVQIQFGGSSIKISDKDDKRGLLNESVLQFYNQNKKEILNIILPIAQETAEEIITQIGNSILNSVPFSELLPA
jgi:hypothetical protein